MLLAHDVHWHSADEAKMLMFSRASCNVAVSLGGKFNLYCCIALHFSSDTVESPPTKLFKSSMSSVLWTTENQRKLTDELCACWRCNGVTVSYLYSKSGPAVVWRAPNKKHRQVKIFIVSLGNVDATLNDIIIAVLFTCKGRLFGH